MVKNKWGLRDDLTYYVSLTKQSCKFKSENDSRVNEFWGNKTFDDCKVLVFTAQLEFELF